MLSVNEGLKKTQLRFACQQKVLFALQMVLDNEDWQQNMAVHCFTSENFPFL